MGKFWNEFKKSWNDQMLYYGMKQPSHPPPDNTGTGNGYDTEPSVEQWGPIYRKFRKLYGRDPYSFKELQDWWDSF